MIPARLQYEKDKANAIRINKAVAYLRVSFDDQAYGESLKTQKDSIQRYADANGIEIVKWFQDEGHSGKTVHKRKMVKDMLYYLARNKDKIGYTLVYKMQRSSRDVLSWANDLKAVLNGLGIVIRSATEPIDESPVGRFMEVMLVANGQLDNDIKSGTTNDNMASVAKQGWWQHGSLPGYKTIQIKINSKKTHTTLKRISHAIAVRELFEEYATGNFSKADIGRMSKEKGVKNSHGTWLNETSVFRMLTQPAYAGYVCDKHTGYEMYEGQHFKEAIVSLELFNQVQEIIEAQSRRDNKQGKPKLAVNPLYPLKKILKCSNCGNDYRGSAPRSGGGKPSARYHCPNSICKGIVVSMKADKVHELFLALLTDITPSEDVLRLYKEVLNRQALKQLGSINNRLKLHRKALVELDNERLDALRNANNGQLSSAEKNDIIAAITADKDNIKDNIASLEEQQLTKQSAIEYALNFMHDVRRLWDDASPELKQKFQSMIFPEGLSFDSTTLTFGTERISPLYRYVPIKNDLSETEKSSLVTPRRVELLLPG